jgi:predicted DsbA family dithiol-disulfide isomerase
MTRRGLVTLAGVALLAACGGGDEPGGGGDEAAGKGAGGGDSVVEVELYVMSKCPYGVQTVDAMAPALEKFGDRVDFSLEYIGRITPDDKLESMHGESELRGDVIQLCAGKLAPDKQLAFIGCQNREWRAIPADWERCAKEAGIDVEALGKCADGAEGEQLVKASFKRAENKGVQGSPTIRIAGEEYRRGRRSDDFVRAICDAFAADQKPAECVDLPPPPKVNAFALTDERCGEKCDPTEVLASLKQIFPGLQEHVLDWSNPDARKMYEEAHLQMLPALLFDESVDKDQEGKAQIARFLVPAGRYQMLRVKGEFDQNAEICDNEQDDTGNGLVDCADPTCAETIACRPEIAGRLDVFVMSQCPFGVLALDAMREVLDAFGDEIQLNVHYIADRDGDGFRSLHGQPEVDENIRELCAIKHFGKNRKYMDYIWCRNQDIRSADWQKCTGANGVATATLERCATGPEGVELLAADIKIGQQLGIEASPSWLVNNRVQFSGITPADVQRNICEHNPQFKGCAKKLSDQRPGQGAAPQGSCQ